MVCRDSTDSSKRIEAVQKYEPSLSCTIYACGIPNGVSAMFTNFALASIGIDELRKITVHFSPGFGTGAMSSLGRTTGVSTPLKSTVLLSTSNPILQK